MLTVDNIKVFNFEGAFRGLRNPLNSWKKADSRFDRGALELGPNDLDLAQRMIAAGTDESKFLRQIFITMDITAPLYWWKEFDTYKVGTVANSCSTMHKIQDKKFTLDDFSYEHLTTRGLENLLQTISFLNESRNLYINYDSEDNSGYPKPSKKEIWWQMIQLLPSSYNQRRTVTLNYQVARAIYFARKNHKLDEWHTLCTALKNLPYGEELICYVKPKQLDSTTTGMLQTLGIAVKKNGEYRSTEDVLQDISTMAEAISTLQKIGDN